MATKDSTTCPILENVKDFQIWKIRIVGKLRREKVYEVITQTRPDSSSPLYPSIYSPSQTDSWEIRDGKAHGIITDHICNRLALATQDMTTAAELFNKLVDLHQNQNVGASAFYTFIEMLDTKWDGDPTSVQDHISALAAADSKLTAMKKPMDEEFLGFLLLHSLPDDPVWEMFKTSVLNSMPKDSKVTFTDVADRLVFNATIRQQDSESALKVTKTSRKKPASKGKNKDYCSYHKMTGHKTENCEALKRQEKGKKKGDRGKETANRSSHDSSDSSSSDSSDSDSDTERGKGSSSTSDVKVSKSLMTRIHAYCSRPETLKSLHTVVLDSGASTHMTPKKEWFSPHSFRKLDPPKRVQFGDHSGVPATGIGNIILRQNINGKETEVLVKNVLYVPAFALTLLSVRKFDKLGFYSTFKNGTCSVKSIETKRKILRGRMRKGLYNVDCNENSQTNTTGRNSTESSSESALATVDINTLHRRLGHISMTRLKRMVDDGHVPDVKSTTGTPKFCEPCALGKMKKLPFTHDGNRASRPLQIIHSDVGGPVTPRDRHGNRFWITFTDDCKRFPWIYFMEKKSQALGIFKQWKKDVQAQFKAEIGEIHISPDFLDFFKSDGGGEFTSAEFERELKSTGTVHYTTAADTPEQNGLAERMNQTLVTLSTTMLIDSGLPKSFWSDAMSTSAFILGRTPGPDQGGESPYKGLFDLEFDISWLRPFGSVGYALIPKGKRRGKFYEKGKKCVLLGYTAGKKAYRLMDFKTRQIFHSRHVRFDEQKDGNTDVVNLHLQNEPSDVPIQWEGTNTHEGFLHPLSKQRGDTKSGRREEKVKSAEEDHNESDSEEFSRRPETDSRSSSLSPSVKSPKLEPLEREDGDAKAPPQTPPRGTPLVQVPTAPAKRPYVKKVWVTDPDSIAASRPRRGQAKIPAPNLGSVNQTTETNDEGSGSGAGVSTTDTAQERDGTSEADGHRPAPPNPSSTTDPVDDDDIFFAGLSNAKPDFCMNSETTDTPLSTEEAFNGPDADKWREALDDEINSLKENEVYEVVDIPGHAKPITSKIVMRTKLDSNGNVERHKIRIVARGFTQREGVDYKEVFAPVANLESIRVIVALAAKYDLELDQMDVTTAYLNGELTEELYLMPPKEVPIPEGKCWRLKRSLYGLKQAGRTWNHTLDHKLKEMKFVQLNAETCLYVYREKNGEVCFLVVYVDDFILAATSRKFMDIVKERLSRAFKMKDLGPATYILGIQIIRNRKKRTISLSQSQYSKTVVNRCGMKDSKPTWTPMAPGLHLTIDDPAPGADNSIVSEMDINGKRVSYASVVGSLMYAVAGTRPDLAYTVSVLGRFSSCPKLHHWKAAKRALRYLNTTSDMVLRYDGRDAGIDMDYKRHKDFSFEGFSDADWSGDPDTSKSTSGFVFITTRGAIGWGSKLQSMISLSSTESEYIGLCNASQHLMWLRTFFEDIDQTQTNPTKLFCDNQAAIILSKDAQFRARTKHIQRKYHFIRDDVVARGQASVIYVPTDDMVADIFTKSLSNDKHWKFLQAMGLRLDTSGSNR